jgi:HEAT repeat protein
LLFVIAILQLLYLGLSQRDLGAPEPEGESLLESLRFFPRILRNYPLILLIAGSGLLVVILQRVVEFQVFGIYARVYPSERELTSFLGLLHAVLSVLEFAITYFVTRPLIRNVGVSRMNLIYPATTMTSLAALTVSSHLPTAIGAHINYDTLYNSIAQPLETLNYNAVPGRFRGRVRVLSDGLIYPSGIALAGVLLIVAQDVLSEFEVTLVAIIFAAAFCAVGMQLGRSYPKSLVETLRSRAVSLDDVGEALHHLPMSYAEEVRQLLTSEDESSRLLGLELAARMEPEQFLGQVKALAVQADSRTRLSLIRFYAAFREDIITPHLQELLESNNVNERSMALEALIARAYSFSDEKLLLLLEDPHLEIRALGCVAARQCNSRDPRVVARTAEVAREDLSTAIRQSLLRSLRSTIERQRIGWLPLYGDLLREILRGSEPGVKKESMEALAAVAHAGETELQELALPELTHSDPRVRAAAYKLLGRVRDPSALERIAAGLEDQNQAVRESAAAALAAFGERSLPVASAYLRAARPEVVDATISAIGRVGTRRAEEMLHEFMQADYRQVADNLRWLAGIPAGEPGWGPLAIALEDSNQRVVSRVLNLLSSLGHGRTLNCVRRILTSRDQRIRADAVEALGSLSHRRFVEPILPLLESPDWNHAPRTFGHGVRGRTSSNHRQLLLEAIHSPDRWIRVGALAVLATKGETIPPEALREDPDPLARAALLHNLVVRAYLDRSKGRQPSDLEIPPELVEKEYAPVNRILFLKNISLFQFLSLEHLLVIDQVLDQQEFLAGETIFEQDSLGTNFFIIFQGQVVIRRKFEGNDQVLSELSAGEFFGEMALFDDSPRSAKAVALTDCTLLSLERNHFHSLLIQRPEIALELCRVISLRLRMANERLGWWRWRVSWRQAEGKRLTEPKQSG